MECAMLTEQRNILLNIAADKFSKKGFTDIEMYDILWCTEKV